MKTILCILDGCGIREESYGNAFKQANKPNFDYLWNNYPHSLLDASGTFVGLPDGQMGNSEVGHTNIGAGRIVYQPLQLINEKIKDKTFFDNENIKEIFNHIKTNDSNLHIFGLLSDGGIHSHIDHLLALLDMVKVNNIKNTYLHLFLDGRDTLPRSALKYFKELENKLSINVKIATISGRYYAMDRDNRFDRLEKAYDAIVNGKGEYFKSPEEVLNANYSKEIDDEFVIPAVLDKDGMVKESDGLLVFNFRPDRLRELFSSLTNPNFNGFERPFIPNLKLTTMFPVPEEVICKNAFQLEELTNTIGEYLSDKGYSQLRIAETEKYAHVTYFFDGGKELELNNCKRILIPSSKVPTYDLEPEMRAEEITANIIKEYANFDFIVVNYANGDMVGHTGNFEATIKSVEKVDECLGKLIELTKNDNLIVIADHGNSDTMLDEKGNVITSHSTAKVPFIVNRKEFSFKDGKLSDVAPTTLKIMGLEVPKEMTGNILIK